MTSPRKLVALAGVLALAACARGAAVAPTFGSEAELIAHARAVHDRALTIDTHVDINATNFTTSAPNYAERLPTQVNLPKMKEGGLDAVFFSIYVGQGPQTEEGYARAHATQIEKFDAVHRLAREIAPGQVEMAYTAADVRRINAAGKLVALMGVENAYGIGTDITRVRDFYARGARYMSLSHNNHSQLSDSNTGERDAVWQWNGLSPLGRQVVAEMNRLGIMIDISHPSKQSMLQTLALSRAPVIASHSSVRALCNHSRNLDDEQLRALAKNGGVMQTVAFASYVKCPPTPERTAAIEALRREFGITGGGQAALARLSEPQRAEYQRRMDDINRRLPAPARATVKDFVDHIDYAVKLIGIDHVGISSDFDGGGGVEGWNDAAETPNVTIELVRRGYTEEQIRKLWSGNLLRVMEQVEKVAAGALRAP